MVVHLVASHNVVGVDLLELPVANFIWERLRSAFDCVLAASLMPDHLHLLLMGEARRLLEELMQVCRETERLLLLPQNTLAVPEASEVRGRQKLWRNFRYVALNQCREGLASCPLVPLHSTYRELAGAVARPLADREALAKALGVPPASPRIHRFVSSDASTAVGGTPPATSVSQRGPGFHGLGSLARAAGAAHLLGPDAIMRRGPARRTFLMLAEATGFVDGGALSAACGVSRRAIRKSLVRPATPQETHALGAARACLADGRLVQQLEARYRPEAAALR